MSYASHAQTRTASPIHHGQMFSIYRGMIDTTSYATFLGFNDQIELAKNLSDAERTTLRGAYVKISEERFNPSDCKSIIQIKVPLRNFPNEYRTFDRDGSERLCVFAHEMHMTLPEYIISIMHSNDFTIITNPIKAPRSAEEVISKLNKTTRTNESPSEMAETYMGSMYKEMETNINWSKAQSAQISELSESVREMQSQIKDLKNILVKALQPHNIPESVQPTRPQPPAPTRSETPRIQDIRGMKKPKTKKEEEIDKRLEEINKPQPAPELPATTEISRVLDSSQYQYFIRNAYKLGLPVAYEQIAIGQYNVKVTVTNSADEQKALSAISNAEAHATQTKSNVKTHREGYEKVLDILCRVYTKESKKPCGLSRTGALSSLADRILEYAASQGLDWQEYDVESIDLFAQQGQIYTSEQADESFNNFVSQNEGHAINETLKEEECSAELLTVSITEYDAISLILSKRIMPMNASLKKIRDTAITTMTDCYYYPNRLEDARALARGWYNGQGTTYDEQLKGTLESFVLKYR